MENKNSYPKVAFGRNFEDVMFHLAAAIYFCDSAEDSEFLRDTFQSLVTFAEKINKRNEKSSK